VAAGTDRFGYNAATGAYGDRVAMGVLDPCKVTRTALQNAGSIAGLILTTACMVVPKPQPQSAGAPVGAPEM
jgi:chaperonin GroEL